MEFLAMIRLLLLAAAGLLGYRLAREYIDEIPSDPGKPRQARKGNGHSSARQHPRKR